MGEQRRVVITGARGMLGQALMVTAPEGVEAIGATRAHGDLASRDGVEAAVARHRPDVVIHAAAWTDVNGCERQPARAFRDNAVATRLVAEACTKLGARLVLISTDYVFDGTKGAAYIEDDTVCPVNVYGETKLAAERAAGAVADHLIIRTQWLFGPGRGNFVASILQAAKAREKLTVIADQWGCPTYTRHLSPMVWRLALGTWQGVVHAAAEGVATWWDVAAAAIAAAGLGTPIERVALEEWPAAARRPRFTVLNCGRLVEWLGAGLPSWREGVEEYVRQFLTGRSAT